VSVASSTQAVTTAAKIGTPTAKRSTLIIHSPSAAAATVWIGGSNVSASNGFPLAAGQTITFTNDGANGMPASQDWYAFASSSVTIQITEAN
jgi:hypothetical protein